MSADLSPTRPNAPSPVRFYNTLTRKLETLDPIHPGEVRLYTCGPTVYDFAHIGNFRAYIFEDLLCRTLRWFGYAVQQVMNLTDIDDKTIAGARQKDIPLDKFTQPYIDSFFEDIKSLNIEPATEYPRATAHIPEMIRLIESLIRGEYAYVRSGSVYYRIARFPHYGRLSHMPEDALATALARSDSESAPAALDRDEYDKEDVRDFALWKAAQPDEPSWPAPFGAGRPGWHIECSAMSMKYLGEQFDIHTGGEDNIFPHHENEIAQSEAVTGKPFVKIWMHCKFLLADGEKMSKSKGNFYTSRDLLAKGCSPRALRYTLLATHYRQPLNFTLAGVTASEAALRRVDEMVSRLDGPEAGAPGCDIALQKHLDAVRGKFQEVLADDLNISGALGVLFQFLHEVNAALDYRRVSAPQARQALGLIEDFDRIIGCFGHRDELPSDVQALVAQREEARRTKDFKRSDAIRRQVETKGYLLMDSANGVRWVKK